MPPPGAAEGGESPYHAHLLRWPALECNPHVFTGLLHSSGLPSSYTCHDVFSLDPDALAFVPRPVLAIILSYEDDAMTKPAPPPSEDSSEEDDDVAQREGEGPGLPPKPFIRQLPSLDNACGTVAALHAVAWAVPPHDLAPGSLLHTFFEAPGSPDELGQRLDRHEGLRARHCFYATQGDTSQLSIEEEGRIKYHFVCLVKQGQDLVEVDGMKPGPVYHKGKAKGGDLLVDCARFIKEGLLPRFPDATSMSIVALTHEAPEGVL